MEASRGFCQWPAVKRVIEGVHVVPMGMVNAFLIDRDDGLTLIDAGFPSKEAAVFGAIRGLGRSPDQLKHLIFTHGHPRSQGWPFENQKGENIQPSHSLQIDNQLLFRRLLNREILRLLTRKNAVHIGSCLMKRALKIRAA
jgi:hypothetical protein